MTTQVIAGLALLLWNLIVFILYGADKAKAQKGVRRISEKALLLCAFCLGGIGAFAGMFAFRHKTRHTKFRVLVPMALMLTLVVAGPICTFSFSE